VKLMNPSAWGYALGCLFFAALFALAAGFTLMTTQLLVEHGFVGMNQLTYGWSILWQLSDAGHGDYSGIHLVAIVISWILLACYMIANSVKKWVKAGIAHDGLEFVCHVLMIIDGIANWNSLVNAPWYWQLLFTLIIYMALAHFGKIIIGLASVAIMEFFGT
jgi:hypothetical protein